MVEAARAAMGSAVSAASRADAFLGASQQQGMSEENLRAIRVMAEMEDELLRIHYCIHPEEVESLKNTVKYAQGYMEDLGQTVSAQLDGFSPQSENFFAHLAPFFEFREGIAATWATLSSGKVEALPAVAPPPGVAQPS